MKRIAVAAAGTIVAAATVAGVFYWVMASEHAYDPTDFLRIAETGRVYRFEVVDSSNTPIWRIASAEGAALSRIDFGVVPPTFQQEVPAASNRPRGLVTGETIRSTTVTETHVLLHEGQASGASSMSWGLSTFTPRAQSPVPRQ